MTEPPQIEKPQQEEINNLKNNKTPGENNIVAELLKKGGMKIKRKIKEIILTIWDTIIFLENWNTAVIYPILKKRDPTKTKNYRGISLLDTCYKGIYVIIIRTD